MERTRVLRRIRTRRRIPIPEKIAFAGENTYKIVWEGSSRKLWYEGAYQANTYSEGLREGIEDLYSRIQPFGQPFIATLRMIKFLDLLLEHDEDVAR